MKRREIALGLINLLVIINGINAMNLNGYFSNSNRISFSSNSQYLRIENLLGIKIESQVYNNASFFSDMDIRLISLPDIKNSSDMSEYSNYYKNEFRLKEMYIKILKFPVKSIDLRVGKQRIVWGAGDEISPNDFINPYDFQDSWSFKNRLGVYSLKTDFYYKDFTISGVFIPYFTADLLPETSDYGIFEQSVFLAPGITVGEMKDTIIIPGKSVIDNIISGGKASYTLSNFDLSLYYLYSKAYLPWIKNVIVIPDTVPSVININEELFYPRIHMIGFSFSGSIEDIGVWGDISAFVPMENSFIIDLSALGMGTIDSTNIQGGYYLKYLLGFDYKFSNEIYVSIQYLHGFINERGNNNLNDYIFVGSRYPVLNDRIQLSPFDLGIEIDVFSDIKSNYGIIYLPSVKIKPYDNLNMGIYSLFSWGAMQTVFGKMKSQRGLQLEINYYF